MEHQDLGAPDIRIHYLKVVNRGKLPFTDRYDGVPVQIDPGRSENLPLDMAAHFFGYMLGVSEEAMFRHTCKRQGWNTPAHLVVQKSGKTLAQDLFAALEIKPVIYKMVEEKPDTDQPIPADPQMPAIEDLPALPKRKAGG